MRKMKLIMLLSLFFKEFLTRSIFIHQLTSGGYLLAVPKSLADSPKHLRKQLQKHCHLPNHEEIDLNRYPSNNQKFNLQGSEDSQILEKIEGYCIGGKQNLNLEENLEQFKKGPCSPLAIMPGILATSLVVEINCEQLQRYEEGKIFRNCGWDTCSFFGVNKPDRQYILWVGIQLILKVSAGLTKCFGDIFGLLYDENSKSEDLRSRYSSAAGISSTWFGNTNQTHEHSKCGANAIRDISGYVSLLSIMGSQCALRDYGRLLDILQKMGYVSGITFQPIPYDFRYGILASQTSKLFPQIINNLYRLTGKKVIILAHSLGTLHTLSSLAFDMNETMKNKMVGHYIAITPPWSGTVSAIRNLLYGDPSYFTSALIDTGINKYGQMKFTETSGSTYDLFLRNIYEKYKDSEWLNEVKRRIQYEKQGRKNITNADLQIGEDDYPMNWFPSKQQLCFDPIFKKNPYCETGLIDFSTQPIFTINNTDYYATTLGIKSLIQGNLPQSTAQKALSLWKQTNVAGKTLNEMPAPGVNTSVIFTTVFNTQVYYKYKTSSISNTSDNTFIEPEVIRYGPGDISVPSFSPLLFLAKWIYERSNGEHEVMAVEYCGKYEGKMKHYRTIDCECSSNPFKNPLDCTHPCIISDRNIIKFIIEKVTNNGKDYENSIIDESVIFTNQQLTLMKNQCLNLHPNNTITHSDLSLS